MQSRYCTPLYITSGFPVSRPQSASRVNETSGPGLDSSRSNSGWAHRRDPQNSPFVLKTKLRKLLELRCAKGEGRRPTSDPDKIPLKLIQEFAITLQPGPKPMQFGKHDAHFPYHWQYVSPPSRRNPFSGLHGGNRLQSPTYEPLAHGLGARYQYPRFPAIAEDLPEPREVYPALAKRPSPASKPPEDGVSL